jgi:hypothetical protein
MRWMIESDVVGVTMPGFSHQLLPEDVRQNRPGLHAVA